MKQEKLAALQSIDALAPADKLSTLISFMNDAEQPDAIRLEAVSLLTMISDEEAESALRAVALKRTDADPLITPEAILALQKRGAMNNSSFRSMIYRQLSNENPDIQRAARTALLCYAKGK